MENDNRGSTSGVYNRNLGDNAGPRLNVSQAVAAPSSNVLVKSAVVDAVIKIRGLIKLLEKNTNYLKSELDFIDPGDTKNMSRFIDNRLHPSTDRLKALSAIYRITPRSIVYEKYMAILEELKVKLESSTSSGGRRRTQRRNRRHSSRSHAQRRR